MREMKCMCLVHHSVATVGGKRRGRQKFGGCIYKRVSFRLGSMELSTHLNGSSSIATGLGACRYLNLLSLTMSAEPELSGMGVHSSGLTFRMSLLRTLSAQSLGSFTHSTGYSVA